MENEYLLITPILEPSLAPGVYYRDEIWTDNGLWRVVRPLPGGEGYQTIAYLPSAANMATCRTALQQTQKIWREQRRAA